MFTPAASRREVMRGGLLAVGGAAAASTDQLLARVRGALAATRGDDAAILGGLLEIERTLVSAYEAVADGDLLEPRVRRAVELFTVQEREHADALAAALVDLGVEPPRRGQASEPDRIDGLDSQRQALELLIELERETVAAYDEAAGGLEARELVKTGLQIVCNQAQHLAVLRQQLGDQPVPGAFERGRSR